MALRKVVFTGVTDVQNMGDFKGLNDVSILRMLPVTQEESSREDLVWIVLGDLAMKKI